MTLFASETMVYVSFQVIEGMCLQSETYISG